MVSLERNFCDDTIVDLTQESHTPHNKVNALNCTARASFTVIGPFAAIATSLAFGYRTFFLEPKRLMEE